MQGEEPMCSSYHRKGTLQDSFGEHSERVEHSVELCKKVDHILPLSPEVICSNQSHAWKGSVWGVQAVTAVWRDGNIYSSHPSRSHLHHNSYVFMGTQVYTLYQVLVSCIPWL